MSAAHAPAGERVLLDAEALQRTLHRIAHEIIEGNERLDEIALIGIHTRGVFVAQRLRRLIAEFAGAKPALGTVDITFYRDDVQVRGREAPLHPQPLVRSTRIEFPLEGKTCVLVDDVLYTGRTIRAAIEALFDYGRPARVWRATMCGAPAETWRTTIVDGRIASIVRVVSTRLSPLTSDEEAAAMLTTSAESRLAATSNDVRVRVEGSRKRLTTVRPTSASERIDGSW